LSLSDSNVRGGSHNVWNINGSFRRVPSDWGFPTGAIVNIYVYWHHGDPVRKISPMKKLRKGI
jgi:hypothetical protein